MPANPKLLVARFLLFVVLIYGVLVGLGPAIGLHSLSTKMYGGISEKLFSNMGEDGMVLFEKVKGNVSINDQDYELTLINKKVLAEVKREMALSGVESGKTKATVQAKNVLLNFWQYGFVPSALLIALVLATPLPWKRKLRALLLAWVTLQIFIFFRIYLTILNHFQQLDWLAIYDYSDKQKQILYFASEKLLYFGSSLIVVVFLWLISISGSDEFKSLRRALFAESD